MSLAVRTQQMGWEDPPAEWSNRVTNLGDEVGWRSTSNATSYFDLYVDVFIYWNRSLSRSHNRSKLFNIPDRWWFGIKQTYMMLAKLNIVYVVFCCENPWKPFRSHGDFQRAGQTPRERTAVALRRSAVLWSLRSIASGPPVMAQMTWLQYVSGLLWKSHISDIFWESHSILLGKRVVYNTLHGHFPTEHPKSPRTISLESCLEAERTWTNETWPIGKRTTIRGVISKTTACQCNNENHIEAVLFK